MVTGGQGDWASGRLASVELLDMNGTWICPMPTMPKPRTDHTQTGPVICGGSGYFGSDARKSCITFFNGGDDWVKTHNLTQNRQYHSAWASHQGVMLMGGYGRNSIESERIFGTTSEILTGDGDTIPGFTLDYRTE